MYHRNSDIGRSCAAVLLFMNLFGTACQAWHTQRAAPESVLVARQPAKLRVTRNDGSRVVIENPVLRGDTLSGTQAPRGGQQDVRIPLTDVRQVATRGFSPGRTVGLGLGVAAGLVAAVVAAYVIGCPSDPSCSN